MNNYNPNQYLKDSKFNLNHSYLVEQFSDYSKIFEHIKKVVKKGDYTLGKEVDKFEKNISSITGAKYAIAVGNGTDALYLVLKALGIGRGDEVITTPFTFVATVAAIATAGAKPVFVDVKEDYNIDEKLIVKAITKKTKAIMPVHWSGRPCELEKIYSIAKKYKLRVIQDSCHAIKAKYKNNSLALYGDACTFSLHPLNNLNVWGDGGFIITNSRILYDKICLIRNHGLVDRNTCKEFAYNSRLDTIQAVVANYKIKNKLENITKKRIQNSLLLDNLLKLNVNIKTNKRYKHLKEVFHLYQILVTNRDELKSFLMKNGVDAKVHYPTPIHLQPAAKYLNYKKGDFPMAEKLAKQTLSLPVHEFIKTKDIKRMASLINNFYL